MTSSRSHRIDRLRRGFVLPLVIISTLLVALLTAAAQAAAWRATRAARLAWNGQRALLAADEAIARLHASWNPQTFSPRHIGNRTSAQITTADGALVDLRITRAHPLIAFVEAAASSATAGTPRPAQRRVARAMHLEPPALPLGAAVIALTPVQLHAGAHISGVDDITRVDACGPQRDSASIAGMQAHAPAVHASATVTGAPSMRVSADSTRDARLWTNALPQLHGRSTTRIMPTGTGAAVLGPPWHATLVQDTAPMLLAASVTHEGLLTVDGDVVITGALHVHGMLLVNGTIDARLGTLHVDGALIVRSPRGATSHVGSGTTVRYSQCAMQRALAAVALPVTQPFALWSER